MTAFGTPERTPNAPLFVSYYTDDFYKNWWETRLKPSLEKHGLQFEVDHVPSFGSWERNDLFKAEFILRKMKQHPDRDIVWVDVDAEIVSPPELLLDPNVGEIAGVLWPHTFTEVPMLLGGTLLFRGTPFVESIVEQWVLATARRKDDIEKIDQQILQEVLEAYTDVFFDLPASYCWIEDMMRPLQKIAEPVVYHYHVAKAKWEQKK